MIGTFSIQMCIKTFGIACCVFGDVAILLILTVESVVLLILASISFLYDQNVLYNVLAS